MIQALFDYYRLPADSFGGLSPKANTGSGKSGFFQFGANNICYGRNRSGTAADVAGSKDFDASRDFRRGDPLIQLPFDFAEVIENIRLERYRQAMIPKKELFAADARVRSFYYLIRKFLPISLRRQLQRAYLRDWKKLQFPAWPVDFTVDTLHEKFLRILMDTTGVEKIPFIWFWPDGAPNCLIMTHDVETRAGRDFTSELMDLDESHGIKAAFQVIPEKRYKVRDEYVQQIRSRGFEFNVHDLNHDGQLYQERKQFIERAEKINDYIKKYQARGFRAGIMYRNLDWYDAYRFSYDMSVPNVAHLEPQRGGCCTVFPYFVGKILEIPLTTCQDYSLFQILNDFSNDLWKKQMELLEKRNGLMSFLTHPDYLINPKARGAYTSLLEYLRETIDRKKIWMTLPGEVDRWWRARSKMKLVQKDGSWTVEGPDSERARVAFAVLEGERLVYKVVGARERESAHP